MTIKIDLGTIVISSFDTDSLFISRPCGEGVEIGKVELASMLEAYLKDNF